MPSMNWTNVPTVKQG
jgi:geranylgeranyl transferase type-2 subunit beta